MKVQEHDTIKNAAPIDDDASGLNNRDQIPTDYYTTNDLSADGAHRIADTYLAKNISLFASAAAKTSSGTLTINQFLDDCFSGKYQEQVEAIRGEQDKDQRDALKRTILPAVTIQSEVCGQRKKELCKNNAVICLDFDGIDDIETAKQKVFTVPYVLAVCTSASGRGLFAIAALSKPETNLKVVLENMQADFEFNIDKSCSDVSRLRFVTYDPDLLVKDGVVPYEETQHPIEPQPVSCPVVPPIRPMNATEIEYRIVPYINAMPAAIQGQNGSAAALNVCNKLYEFGLDVETAKQVFSAYYNPRCVPPWSDQEIDHKLETAYSKPLKEAGCMLDKPQEAGTTCPARRDNAALPAGNGRIKLTRFEDIEDRPPEWFMYNKFPANDINIVSGEGGSGKTYFTCHLAAHVTNGTPWADGTPCKKGSVIFFPPEGQKAALKRRLVANGVDLSKCRLLDGVTAYDVKTDTWGIDFISLADSAWISEAIDAVEQDTGEPAALVIIDPVGNFAGRSDSYKDTEVRQMLAPLQRLADEKKVTFLLVAHHNKAEHSSAQKKVMGSGAWVNIARAHWVISVDKEDKNLRYCAPSKYNDCIDPKAIAYRIVSQGGQWEGQVQIVSMDVDKTATDYMHEQRQENKRGRKPEKRDEAMDWLRNYLADGEKEVTEIYEAGAVKEFSESTIDRAKKNLRILSVKDGTGWKWKLHGDGQRQKWSRD